MVPVADQAGAEEHRYANPVDDPEFYCHGQKCLDEGCTPLACAQMEAAEFDDREAHDGW